MNTISNDGDVIDSRDVIARLEELEGERDAEVEAAEERWQSYAEERVAAMNRPEPFAWREAVAVFAVLNLLAYMLYAAT